MSIGFRDEFSNGWNEVHGRAKATYTFTNTELISNQPEYRKLTAFTTNNAKFLPPTASRHLAWSPIGGNTRDSDPRRIWHVSRFAGCAWLPDRSERPVQSYLQSSHCSGSFHGFRCRRLLRSLLQRDWFLVELSPNLYTPTLVSWSFRIQQELTANTSLTVGYVGSHGYHEIIGIDANEPFPVICPNAPCPAAYPSTFPAGIAGTPVPAGTYYVPTSTKPNATIANTWTYFSEGDSSYHALQVDLNHRFTDGLSSLRGVYTFSKTLDDGDSLNATTSGGEPALASNPFDLCADKGLANFDVRNVGVVNLSYALPFGPGRHFLTGASGAGKAIAGGWTITTRIVTLQDGFPFTPQLSSYNPSNTGDTRNPVRPFVNPAFSGPVILGNPNQWFNPAAFLAPPNASGFYGNLGRDTLIGPGLATWDLSLLKDIPVRERVRIQFRAEFFNVLNRANFNTPNAITFTPTGASPTAGVITSTSTTSRQIQFGLKLLW